MSEVFDWFERIWPILLMPLGWLIHKFKELDTKIHFMEKSFYETKSHAETTYLSRQTYREDQELRRKEINRIYDKLDSMNNNINVGFDRIYDKLDTKADK